MTRSSPTTLFLPFVAPIPPGHRIRTYRAERRHGDDWIPAGNRDVIYDVDAQIVFGVIEGVRRAPGEPVSGSPDARIVREAEHCVAWCLVSGHGERPFTEIGVEPSIDGYR